MGGGALAPVGMGLSPHMPRIQICYDGFYAVATNEYVRAYAFTFTIAFVFGPFHFDQFRLLHFKTAACGAQFSWRLHLVQLGLHWKKGIETEDIFLVKFTKVFHF